MERADVDGLTLEYETHGSGEPLVLLHAGLCADWFRPLVDEPALASRRLIRYHRVGYAGSSRLPGAVSLADQARHCLALMDHLGVDRAHLAGHSSSADIAMQVALDAPERVASLALLEPALMPVRAGRSGAGPQPRPPSTASAAAITRARSTPGCAASPATHLLHVANPRGMAEALDAFAERHPV